MEVAAFSLEALKSARVVRCGGGSVLPCAVGKHQRGRWLGRWRHTSRARTLASLPTILFSVVSLVPPNVPQPPPRRRLTLARHAHHKSARARRASSSTKRRQSRGSVRIHVHTHRERWYIVQEKVRTIAQTGSGSTGVVGWARVTTTRARDGAAITR
ncbi:hypothetical protein HYPSUDRAFT_484324 [Hypholoma sublateritium FD-334 SS-4]|uniref:Uncharacterized protein n=1 Tax=Hypholoma sublateritium (strain FD-334 SS-4) TaxID=945553 RepID=A0A0D2N3P7_HYPSF|nr:hypothetical protein HYPSUDRAFT_484324 [Hypholoma sublateritium FD-334 SS-4]